MSEVVQVKEALVGVLALVVEIIKLSKDGLQGSDVVELIKELMDNPVYVDAIKGLGQVPTELGAIDLKSGLEIVTVLIDAVPAILEALKA
jgi:hypothetical protein